MDNYEIGILVGATILFSWAAQTCKFAYKEIDPFLGYIYIYLSLSFFY